jgi:hypothetical protein
MKKIIIIIVSVFIGLYSFSQESETKSDILRKDALKIFMEEADDFIRNEISYVNYVRDIKDADVYIITTSQSTGSGGNEYTFFITGQNEFAGMADTVSFVSLPNETTDVIRQKAVVTLKMGLMRYVAKTPLSKYISINFSEPMTQTVTTDKWNNWVFSPSFSTYFSGQKTYKYRYVSGSIKINRITQDWKIRFEMDYSYSINKYDLGTSIVTSDNIYKYGNAMVAKSLSDHWSFGGVVIIGANTYQNRDFISQITPGIEYDLFPYSESTRRQFTILYRAGSEYSSYHDTTIYNKTGESLWVHKLTAAYKVIQKWGSINVSLGYSNYLHDWSKNNINFDGDISLRITKGLSMNLYGGFSFIHDQLNLAIGGASAEQILTRQKELATQYSYYGSFGFSYTFGSIYKNVVNPRFENLAF